MQDIELAGVFDNALDALDYLKANKVDLLFLDIHLPKLSGMDFLNLFSPRPFVILTTAFSEYALKSYDYDVTDYLLKPFSFERFVKAVYKAKGRLGKPVKSISKNDSMKNKDQIVIVKTGYEYLKLGTNEIVFIKSDGDYTQVHLHNGRIMVSYSLKYWLGILPESIFYRVHRSYIINSNFISKITSGKILIGNMEIPIGRVYKKEFLKLIKL